MVVPLEEDMVNVIHLILEVSNEPAGTKKMDKIMYTALFKHPQLKVYWKVLSEKGLLRYDLDTKMFKTTEKGRMFIEAFTDSRTMRRKKNKNR